MPIFKATQNVEHGTVEQFIINLLQLREQFRNCFVVKVHRAKFPLICEDLFIIQTACRLNGIKLNNSSIEYSPRNLFILCVRTKWKLFRIGLLEIHTRYRNQVPFKVSLVVGASEMIILIISCSRISRTFKVIINVSNIFHSGLLPLKLQHMIWQINLCYPNLPMSQ